MAKKTAKKAASKKISTAKKSSSKTKARSPKKAAKPAKKVSPIPKGYNQVTPCLVVGNGAKAIDFYKKVFKAKVGIRLENEYGRIAHAELSIGDSKIMMCDEAYDMGARAPEAFGGSPVGMHLYLKNADKTMKAALEAGATMVRPLVNMYYGDRTGTIKDPFGHTWHLATRIEDISPATLKKRADALFGKKRKK